MNARSPMMCVTVLASQPSESIPTEITFLNLFAGLSYLSNRIDFLAQELRALFLRELLDWCLRFLPSDFRLSGRALSISDGLFLALRPRPEPWNQCAEFAPDRKVLDPDFLVVNA